MRRDDVILSEPDSDSQTIVAGAFADAPPACAAPDHTAPRALHSTPAVIGLSAIAAAALAACGGGGSSGGTITPSTTTGPGPAPGGDYKFPQVSANSPDSDAARFLLQAQFSASEAEIAAVKSAGYWPWLAQQMDLPTTQSSWDWLESRGYGNSDINRYFFNTYPFEFAVWKDLLSANDSVRKRVALALSEFFVISLQTAEFNWRSHAFAAYWDMLNKNAFGNFRQLLEDVSLNPAMGYYLNTKGNQKENPATGRLPDENYAREVMQLFSIGLFQLNQDGSVKTDAQGKKLETYVQADVTNLARVFTGYDFDTSDGVRVQVLKNDGTPETYTVESRDFARKPMALTASRHSTLAASFLGTTIAANTPGAAALKIALDALFNHPNVGPFFGKQMIQRLVTSNPSPAYVARVAAVFNDNGKGVRGDLRSVWAAILLDDEARGPAGLTPSNGFGKLREPMLRLVQWARTFGATSAAGSWKLFDQSNASNQVGQSPFRSPSVFNYFRPGYVPPGTALAATQTTAPEFQIVNETTTGGYLNAMQNTIRAGLYCPEPTVPQAAYTNYLPDIKAAYTAELALVLDPPGLVKRLNLLMCAGQMSAATEKLIADALLTPVVTAASTADQKLNRVCAAVLLTMACPEYLIQK